MDLTTRKASLADVDILVDFNAAMAQETEGLELDRTILKKGVETLIEQPELGFYLMAESGQEINWEQALASNRVLAPGLQNFTMDSTPPVVPDAEGRYPIAVPGQTKVL